MHKSLAALALVSSFWMSSPVSAANDYFLKIAGIDGESAEIRHEKWIDVENWTWGVTNTSGTPVLEDFFWIQGVDKSVVPIFLGVSTGQNFSTATLDVVKQSGKGSNTFFQMVFSDVTLNSLHLDNGGDTEKATATLEYTSVKLRYRAQKIDGSFEDWIEGNFALNSHGAVNFSGDPGVVLGLMLTGGDITLDAVPSAVPEPQTWALLLSGMLLTASAVARRRSMERS